MEILGKNGQQYYFISESRGRIGDMLSPLSSFFVSLSYLIPKCVLLHCKPIQLVLHGLVLLSGHISNTVHIGC